MHKISKRELFQAQIALFAAILLQIVVWRINHHLFGSQYLIILVEIALAVILGLFANSKTLHRRGLYKTIAFVMLGLISVANIISLITVLDLLINSSSIDITGFELLTSAIAIFLTNIIVYSLWYWEVDSPGLSRKRWSKNDQDFLFTQQEHKERFPSWQPEFLDYLFLSVTNAINFAPSDTKPLTRNVKFLMGSQALVSVFTLALVVARSVSILGS